MSFHSRTKTTTNALTDLCSKFEFEENNRKGVHTYPTPERYRRKKYQWTYTTSVYREKVDPHTGKLTGWNEAGYKERGLKKRVRRYGKQLIEDQLIELENQVPCNWCGCDDCDNPISCEQEEERYYENERLMYEEEDQKDRERQEEYSFSCDLDDYWGDYNAFDREDYLY